MGFENTLYFLPVELNLTLPTVPVLEVQPEQRVGGEDLDELGLENILDRAEGGLDDDFHVGLSLKC